MLTGRHASAKHLPPDDVVLVGGFYDIAPASRCRVVYVEHGAGQSYKGDARTAGHPSYHGSSHPSCVVGYVSPNKRVADSWGRPAIAVGCPALDEIPLREIRFATPKTAAITFHFDARGAFVAPEAWSARMHYIDLLHSMIGHLRSLGFDVLGSWHPRDSIGPMIWENLGVEATADPTEVLTRAHLLIADNTSLMYEAAHLGIPVGVLNAPWYRRDVEHGLRFWDHVPGAAVDSPEEFVGTDWFGYSNALPSFTVGRSAADYAYSRRPGGCGEMAARWVEQLAAGEI